MLLRLIARGPTAPTLTLVNGAVATGYTILNTIDFGNASWQHALSGARGTQGARPSWGEPENRVVSIPVHIGPTGSVDSFNVLAANLVEMVDELRRFGGRILYQATGQTPRQYLDVMLCGITRESWGRKGARVDSGDVTILAQCAPYMLGDSMDTLDGFDTDSITAGDYTFDIANSGAGALSVAGGTLVPGATGAKRVRYTAKGYVYGDVLVGLKVHTGAVVTGGVWGITARAKIDGTDVNIEGRVYGTAATAPQVIYNGGTGTVTGGAFNPAANSDFWMVLVVSKQQVRFNIYTSKPTVLSTPTSTAVAVFSVANAQVYDAPAHVGMRITSVDAAERYDDFRVEPFTFWNDPNAPQPELTRSSAPIPGDVPAIVDAVITPRAGTVSPIWGMLAYHERALISNAVWNGDFEDANIAAAGWATPIVAGVLTAAGTSVARITTAGNKYGVGALRIVTPATTDAGATFRVQRRYKAGDQVLAWAWLSSVAGTTSTVIKAGISGSIATGTAAALSATPKLYAVLWSVGGAADQPYVVIAQAAATATNIDADGVGLCVPPICNLGAAIVSTSATSITVSRTPVSDVPNLLPDGTLSAPFLALIDLEIVRVWAIAGNVWSVDRGVEGTTAATHLISTFVAIFPPLRSHFEGKGASPAFGLVEAEDYVSTLSSAGGGAFSVNADALGRMSTFQRWAPVASGVQTATYIYLVDPNLLTPDDYTLGELDVEVYLRQRWSSILTNTRVTISAQPEGGTTLGPERFTREFGTLGKLLVGNNGSNGIRLYRCGSLPMIVDRTNPIRWRLKVRLDCTSGASPTWDLDTIFLVATRGRLASPTGETNDTAVAGGSYPGFVPYDAAWGASSGVSKTARSDGSALVGAPGGYGFPDQGLGDVLEMPDTDFDFFVRTSNLVPDDPTIDSTTEPSYSIATDVHFVVTPRYVLARSV